MEEYPQIVQTPSKALTLAEFLQSPETKPESEYIDGQIIQKPNKYLQAIARLVLL